MKKIGLYAIISVLFLISFTIQVFAEENCHSMINEWYGNETIANSIPKTVKEYFDVRKNSLIDSSLFTSNYASEKVQKNENERRVKILEMQCRMNINIVDVDKHIQVLETKVENSNTILTIKEWFFYDYDDLDVEGFKINTAGFGTTHTLIIDKNDTIIDDLYDESETTGIITTESKNTNLISKNMSSSIENIEESNISLMSTNFYSSYNVDAVVTYADKYWQNYNTNFANYNPYGGDCTNFTSQCILAGGMPQVLCSSGMTNGWYYNSTNDRSGTWTVAGYLRNWMANNRGVLVNNPSPSQIYKGSPVFYSSNGGSTWAHATICVGTNSEGTPIIDSHNNDYYHTKWNYWGSSTTYSTVQLTPSNNYTNIPAIQRVVCTTNDASNIGNHSATLSGHFTNPGGAKIVKRGFQWSTTTDMTHYTMFDCNITWEDGLTHNQTTFSPNTTYYYKFVVQGEDGTYVYGNMKSLTTGPFGNMTVTTNDAYNIKTNSATFSGSFSNPNGFDVKKRGFVIGTSSNNLNWEIIFDCDITWSDGLTHTQPGLKAGTTYYYKFVIGDGNGNYKYGGLKSFTTRTALDTVTVTTKDAYNITSNSATFHGSFEPGDYTIKKRGYVIGTDSNNLNWEIIFNCDITWSDGLTHTQPGLQPGTTYYYRMVVGDGNGNYKYGGLKSFTTACNNLSGLYAIRHVATGKYITMGNNDIEGNPTTLVEPRYSGALDTDQQLYFELLSNGAYKITSKRNGYAFEVGGLSKDNAAVVQQWGYGGISSQQWYVFRRNDGYYKLVNVNSRKALDIGSKVQQYEDNNADAQKFEIIPLTYEIIYNANGGTGAPDTQYKVYNQNLTLCNSILTRPGYVFWGWADNVQNAENATYPAGGTFTGNYSTTLYAVWKKATYTNHVQYWTWGYKNGEGDNTDKNAFFVGEYSWNGAFSDSQTFTENMTKEIRGFNYQKKLVSPTFTGEWISYSLPYTFSQPAQDVWANIDYVPTAYEIRYELDGGVNNNDNPTEYNILYGVKFKEPTKEGYVFKGWKDKNGNDIAGVNENCNASFTSVDDFYNAVNSRTIGEITVKADWEPITPYTESVVSEANNTYAISTDFINITSGKIIVAGYKDNKLVNFVIRDYSQENESFELSGDIDTIKVMVWDGLNTLVHLTSAEVIPQSSWATE